MTIKNVGFIGLGAMGSVMAPLIVKSGCNVLGYDIKAKIDKSSGVKQVKDIKELSNLDVVIFMLPDGKIVSEVAKKLMDMNLSDLQELAVTVGVFPSGTKNSLRTKLKKQFVADTRGGGVQVVKSKQRKLDPSDPKQAETIRLMREGL